ncbi:uncharacterized protein LOC127240196 [Andrographis paniculata]|uniref:uncharacterized protein LOC127240196 n=1 Tax=Andrographis paniculata TaxID=175694 RepID=UPI0021E7CF35|nr:uncharacterized protein LOC127240196 [Andrographis paniculata]
MDTNAAGEDHVDGEDYLKLEEADGAEASMSGVRWWWWAKILAVVSTVVVLAVVFFIWIEPVLMDKEIIPIINWERRTFSKSARALIVFCSLVIFPSVLLPSKPSMWIAGMTFGYGLGFLLILAGVAIGASIPYFVGSLFRRRIHVWLEKYPKEAFLIRVGGAGNWLSQFRAVALIRVSSFPYILYNYCAVATDVKYGPYLLGTLVGMVPDILFGLYTGGLIKTLAQASYSGQSLSPVQIAVDVAVFGVIVAATVVIAVYGKRRLENLQAQEQQEVALL